MGVDVGPQVSCPAPAWRTRLVSRRSVRRPGRCWPGPLAAAPSDVAGSRGRPAADDSPACSCDDGLPPCPVRRSRRRWSPGRSSEASLRALPRRPRHVPAVPGSPGPSGARGPKAAQECPQGGRRLDRTVPQRSASASSMQSPPARADATRVRILSPAFARPGASPRSRWLSASSLRPSRWAKVTGRSVRHWPPGGDRRRLRVSALGC